MLPAHNNTWIPSQIKPPRHSHTKDNQKKNNVWPKYLPRIRLPQPPAPLSPASGSPLFPVKSTEPRRTAGLGVWTGVFGSTALGAMCWALGAVAPTHRSIPGGGQAVPGLGGHLLLCASWPWGKSTTSGVSARQHLLNASYSKRHMQHHPAFI